jgi:hypothetical protein
VYYIGVEMMPGLFAVVNGSALALCHQPNLVAVPTLVDGRRQP